MKVQDYFHDIFSYAYEVEFYSELYYQAIDDFYNKYEDNEAACDYFFKCTD